MLFSLQWHSSKLNKSHHLKWCQQRWRWLQPSRRGAVGPHNQWPQRVGLHREWWRWLWSAGGGEETSFLQCWSAPGNQWLQLTSSSWWGPDMLTKAGGRERGQGSRGQATPSCPSAFWTFGSRKTQRTSLLGTLISGWVMSRGEDKEHALKHPEWNLQRSLIKEFKVGDCYGSLLLAEWGQLGKTKRVPGVCKKQLAILWHFF